MSSPNGYLTQSPGLRLRPVPELRLCLAYRPRPPRLFKLNPTAWLLLELIDGCSRIELVDRLVDAVGGNKERAEELLEAGLAALLEAGLILDQQRASA